GGSGEGGHRQRSRRGARTVARPPVANGLRAARDRLRPPVEPWRRAADAGDLLARAGALREDALAYYHRLIELQPDSVRARAELGGLYLRVGRVEEARREFAQAAKLSQRADA